MNAWRRTLGLIGLCFGLMLLATGGVAARADAPAAIPPSKTPIQHFIFLMQENHSFDNYFGTYPGAEGVPPNTCMPRDPFDPESPCVKPFHIEGPIVDLGHNQRVFEGQLNGGHMDGFIYFPQWIQKVDTTLAMGYYDDRDLPYYWNIADEYVLFDRFYSSSMGGSVRNHMYWATGTPGNYVEDTIPAEGFGDLPTIFDRLQERGIPWKFYVQRYDPSITYRTHDNSIGDRRSQVVWVPLLNYSRYIDNQELASHIVDLEEFYQDLADGTLPAVAYIAPSGASEHPPGSIRAGERFVRTLVNALMESTSWSSSAFLWSYDDWGGWYDHVPPPRVDEYGYGFRVPALLVSAFARRGYVDSTEYDFTSALKFIEENWGLEPLAERDARANSIVNAFDFSSPRAPRLLPSDRVKVQKVESRGGVIYGAYGAALVLAGAIIAAAFISLALPGRKAKDMRRPAEEGAA